MEGMVTEKKIMHRKSEVKNSCRVNCTVGPRPGDHQGKYLDDLLT